MCQIASNRLNENIWSLSVTMRLPGELNCSNPRRATNTSFALGFLSFDLASYSLELTQRAHFMLATPCRASKLNFVLFTLCFLSWNFCLQFDFLHPFLHTNTHIKDSKEKCILIDFLCKLGLLNHRNRVIE